MIVSTSFTAGREAHRSRCFGLCRHTHKRKELTRDRHAIMINSSIINRETVNTCAMFDFRLSAVGTFSYIHEPSERVKTWCSRVCMPDSVYLQCHVKVFLSYYGISPNRMSFCLCITSLPLLGVFKSNRTHVTVMRSRFVVVDLVL